MLSNWQLLIRNLKKNAFENGHLDVSVADLARTNARKQIED